jgi:hypothetical protein
VFSGVTLIDDTVGHVDRMERHRVAAAGVGNVANADLYRLLTASVLLGRTLASRLRVFARRSCDRAVVGGWEPAKSFARTRPSRQWTGWCWQIDHEHRINRICIPSDFSSDEAAEHEF